MAAVPGSVRSFSQAEYDMPKWFGIARALEPTSNAVRAIGIVTSRTFIFIG